MVKYPGKCQKVVRHTGALVKSSKIKDPVLLKALIRSVEV